VNIAVIGPGHIGGNLARRLARAGHRVTLSFARDTAALQALADEIGGAAATPADAVASAEVVILSVPWSAIPAALDQTGPLDGKIVVDTTNQFGAGPMPVAGQTAAAFNAARMPTARYTKTFNTLTAAFQAAAADRPEATKVVQWVCGDDLEAKTAVMALVRDAGYVSVDLGDITGCAVMEAPRRPGAVYGEEYRSADADAVVAALQSGRPLPAPPPRYHS